MKPCKQNEIKVQKKRMTLRKFVKKMYDIETPKCLNSNQNTNKIGQIDRSMSFDSIFPLQKSIIHLSHH